MAIRDMRRFSTGERRSHFLSKALAGAFVPLISDRDMMFHSDEELDVRHRRPGRTDTRTALGTISESAELIHEAKGRIIAMRTKYLAAIVIAVLAAVTGLTVNFVGPSPSQKQSMPSAVQAADRLAASVDTFLVRAGG
ncbi:hypothetical protein H8A97_34280 [Bradyrhizobium sp. Arg62]|uniref:hypothetical protein n=1 Tax=Bradyrhizobium brasilense TaxID=1419277 RepID=UPI001E60BF42|nr:hypothetical protein [Bradyrhizobium brasilense]MCC8950022.1 hypothetical protein [Bradyrhizobium brasilense]